MAFNSIPPIPTWRVRKFWLWVQKPDVDACWPYPRVNHYGYAQIRIGKRTAMVHRIAWTLTHGPIPKGLFVCHRCDNGACCNPRHLFLGTAADNNRDRDAKDRVSHGSAHWKAKVTETDIPEIKRLRESGMTQQAIADKYGVQQPAIWKILSGRLWRRIKKERPQTPAGAP